MELPPKVTGVTVVRPYVLRLKFSDGVIRMVDLGKRIQRGEIFEPLKDPDFFSRVVLDGETIAWPNGAGFVPEFLYREGTKRLIVRQQAILQLVAAGVERRGIARQMFISESTVNREMRNIFNQLEVNDAACAVAEAHDRLLL